MMDSISSGRETATSFPQPIWDGLSACGVWPWALNQISNRLTKAEECSEDARSALIRWPPGRSLLAGPLEEDLSRSSIDYGHWDKTNSGYRTLPFISRGRKTSSGVKPPRRLQVQHHGRR